MSPGYGAKMDRYGGDPHQGYQIPPPISETLEKRESNTMRELREMDKKLSELNNVIDMLHSKLDGMVLPLPKPERTGTATPQMCSVAAQINAYNYQLQYALDRLYTLHEGIDL